MRKPRAKPVSTASKAASLRAQMEQLQTELKRVEVEEEASFGKLARKAGLLDIDAPEAEMLEALKGIVEGFRTQEGETREASEA